MKKSDYIINKSDCSSVQKIMAVNGGNIKYLPEQDKRHFNHCDDCREFAKHVLFVHSSLRELKPRSLRPRKNILRQLKASLDYNCKNTPSIVERILDILNYPIPAYQVIVATFIIASLILGANMLRQSTRIEQKAIDSFYLADSTHEQFLSGSESVYEDTVWSRFMVTF